MVQLTGLDVPFHVAVEEMHARIVGLEPHDQVPVGRDGNDVAAQGTRVEELREDGRAGDVGALASGYELDGVAVEVERMGAGLGVWL